MLNKLFNRYLLVLFGVALSFCFTLNAQAADPTIHAVSNGGDWNDINTWTEGRIPTSSDTVEINGTVNVTGDATIAGLYVSSNAIFQNKSGITARITVNGDVLNNSTVQHNNDQYAFYLTVSGNITNNWVWNNSWTDLSSTQSRVVGGTYPLLSPITFLDNFEFLNSPVFNGGVNFNGKTITLSSSTQSITLRANSTLSGMIAGSGSLIFDNNININGTITANQIIFESGLLTGADLTANQFVIRGSGNKKIADEFVNWMTTRYTTFNGSTIIEAGATIHNKDGETSRLIINGDIVNNGTIQRNTEPNTFIMTVSGNITNNGTWNNSWTDLSSTRSRTIDGTNPLLSGVTFLDNFEFLNSPVFPNGANLNNKTITLASSSEGISVAGNSTLSGTIILSSSEQNVNLNGTITASTTVSGPGSLVISGANVKGSLTADKIIFESGLLTGANLTANQLIVRGAGNKTIIDDYVSWNIINNTTFNGPVVIEEGATLQNQDWESPRLIVNGSIINNGTIKNNANRFLYMTVSGNITNNGTWSINWTDLSSTQSRTISGTNNLLSQVTFVDNFEILNSPTFPNGANLNNKTITLASSSEGISVAGNSTLSGTIILSSSEQNVNLNGTITASTTVSGPGNLVISGANVKGSLTADHMIFESGLFTGTYITVDQLIVRGAGDKTIADDYVSWNIINNTTFNGSVIIEEGTIIHNKEWENSRLIINGDVVNNGSISNNSHLNLYMTVSGNITNNGTWNNGWIDLSSTQSRTIGGTNNLLSGVTFVDNFEFLNSPVFDGGVNFNGKTIALSSSTQSITLRGGSTLSGTLAGPGSLIIANNASTNGTITANKIIIESGLIKGSLTADQIIFESGLITGANFTVNQLIVRGAGDKTIADDYVNWNTINNTTFNGPVIIEEGATIHNKDWENSRLIINGDVVDNGSISNNSHYNLYLTVSGNITNNGIWNNSETKINWPVVFGTTEYEVNITENNNNWPVAATTTDTSYNISNLVSSSRYWRVRPTGGYWSSVKRINAGLFGGFTFNTIDSSSQMATRPISLTITSVDINGDPYNFVGTLNLSASNNGTTTPSTITMSNGSWTGTTSISMFGNNVTLTATGGGESGTSNAFNIKKKPVIIVSGIVGTRLRRSTSPYSEIWPNVDSMSISQSDDYLNELILNNDGWPVASSVVTAGDIIREITVVGFNQGHYFDQLLSLLDDNGYNENENLFVFPYDWRLDINYTADNDFKNKIESIKSQTGAKEVDVVAHSMGGLIVEKYIKDYGQGSIDKFIDIATPHLGSPSVAKTLLYGDNFDFNKFFGLIGLNSNKVKEISQNFPSIYQLLPSQNYFYPNSTLFNSYIVDSYDADNNNATGTLNYDQSIEYITNMGGNATLAATNEALHNDLDGFNPNDYGIKAYNITGCHNPTIGWIEIINHYGASEYEYGLHYVNGDGTVPLDSAKALSNTVGTYYNYTEDNDATHAHMPSFDSNKQLVTDILSATSSAFVFNSSQYQNISQSDSYCGLLTGWQVSYHSPIALHIYDEQGRHVGPDAKGNIEINIPGAAYDVIGDNKFAFVPKGHNYKIIGQATGLGHFNARVQDIQDGKTVSEAYYNEVPIKSLSTNIEIDFANNKPNYEMKIDQKGDKIFNEKIKPNSILNAKETEDRIKPETKAEISGQTIKLISGDDNSKVLKTEYSLDGGKTWNLYSKTIDISNLDSSAIQYKSTDRAGNMEDIKEQIILTGEDKLSPRLSSFRKIRF